MTEIDVFPTVCFVLIQSQEGREVLQTDRFDGINPTSIQYRKHQYQCYETEIYESLEKLASNRLVAYLAELALL